ncbi:hypothetical protein BC940DRAFT_304147 [Gongronella butleri]|nr:hypothetical protein BC940DRAFT_304147 [Gongronella butleri]
MNDYSSFYVDSHTATASLHQLSKSSPSRIPPFLYKRASLRQDQLPLSPPTNHSSSNTSKRKSNGAKDGVQKGKKKRGGGERVVCVLPVRVPSVGIGPTLSSFSSFFFLHDFFGQVAPSLGHVPCKFFKQGTCTAGANCTFSHNLDLYSETAVCRYYLKGNCKFGNKCALLHSMAPSVRSNGMAKPRVHYHHQQQQQQQHARSPFYASSLEPGATAAPPSGASPGPSPGSAAAFVRPLSIHGAQAAGSPFFNKLSPSSSLDDAVDYEVNDALLPSSLNDLLTPSELQLRRAREHHDRMTDELYATSPSSSHQITMQPMSPSNRFNINATAAANTWTAPAPIAMPSSSSASMLPASPPVSSWPWFFDDDPLPYQARHTSTSSLLPGSVNSNLGQLPPIHKSPSPPNNNAASAAETTTTPSSDTEPFDFADDDVQFFMEEVNADRTSPQKSPITTFVFPSLSKKPHPFV